MLKTTQLNSTSPILIDVICFDENAKEWINTTKPAYRKRSFVFPHENHLTNKSDLPTSIVVCELNDENEDNPHHKTKNPQEQISHNNNNNNNYNMNNNLTEIELVNRSSNSK